ncbi:MAG: 4-hydroxybenzoyl-CoA thioesterase [Planctomycetota bacterium]|nr:MAG: 4-hydroxybenzoyl-CoA thioesterase [Planctomycetota bacterium]
MDKLTFKNSPWTAETLFEIPFFDIDIMEVAWHGHYIKYFEIGRATLLRKINYDYPQMKESFYSWPVIEVQCRYVTPATYGMKVVISAAVVEFENRFKLYYQIRNAETNRKICKGHTVQVAVDMRTKEMCYASPEILIKKLEQFKDNT